MLWRNNRYKSCTQLLRLQTTAIYSRGVQSEALNRLKSFAFEGLQSHMYENRISGKNTVFYAENIKTVYHKQKFCGIISKESKAGGVNTDEVL